MTSPAQQSPDAVVYHSQVRTDGTEHHLVHPYLFLFVAAAVVATNDHVREGARLQAVGDILQHVLVQIFGMDAQ